MISDDCRLYKECCERCKTFSLDVAPNATSSEEALLVRDRVSMGGDAIAFVRFFVCFYSPAKIQAELSVAYEDRMDTRREAIASRADLMRPVSAGHPRDRVEIQFARRTN